MIWDLATRIFHWLFAISIITSIVSGLREDIDIHTVVVKIVFVLLIFRVIWGIVGYKTARFSFFIKSPQHIIKYLKGNYAYIGHNPLGALSVLAMLAIVGLQLTSGLFITDEILFEAPFYNFVSKNTQNIFLLIHNNNFYLIILLIVLHLSAIFYYMIKGENLIKQMITGKSEKEITIENIKNPLLKFIISLAISFLTVEIIFSFS